MSNGMIPGRGRWVLAFVLIATAGGAERAADAAPAALRFFNDGTLVGMTIGGTDVLGPGRERSGFHAALFDGLHVREVPLTDVVATETTLRVTGPKGFPRLTFNLETIGAQLVLRLVRVEGMPRGRDASVVFRAATSTPVFARATSPDVTTRNTAAGVTACWTTPGASAADAGVLFSLEALPATPQKPVPPAAPGFGGQDAPLPFTTISAPGGGQFTLLRFNGLGIDGQRLFVRSWDGESLVLGPPDAEKPRFTLRVAETPDYLALHLVAADGDFSARDTSLVYEAREEPSCEAFQLDYMGCNASGGGRILLVWPYLWNPNRADPLGAFGIIRASTDEARRDRCLAALWAEGTLPHPDVGEPWTAAKALDWVDAYHRTFAGLSETMLSAATPGELESLTDWLNRAGIRRVYLHTDTWREEYWPRRRSFVAVNPAMFPGGRPDLIAYSRALHGRGMQLRLHSVSGGIGVEDPEFVRGAAVDPRLATWVCGSLAAPTDSTATDLLFSPDPGAELPHVRLEPRVWDLRRFRIGGEIIEAGSLDDVDRPVWRLSRVRRGVDGTPAVAHAAGAEAAGLICAYGQNYVPDNNGTLLEELATRYAGLINEAWLDHQHYDGAEIHRHLEPWGFDKFSWLVARRLGRAVTSSTSGGRPSPWNFELHFGRIRRLDELGYWALAVPVLLEGHRPASSWLDAHYEIASRLLKPARRLGFYKPEPMFGVSEEIRTGHGLMPQFEQLVADWRHVVGCIGPQQTAYLQTMLQPTKSQLQQAGHHDQSSDVPVFEARDDGYYFVPTRVLVREGVDAAWTVGQEFGAYGPRQYLQPGDRVSLTNPYPTQQPDIILRVLPALAPAQGGPQRAPAPLPASDARLSGYRAGADQAGRSALPQAATSVETSSLMPPAHTVTQRGATTLAWQPDGILLTATNPTAAEIWAEESLPTWGHALSLGGRRGLLLDVEADGGNAWLIVQLHGEGTRDYVVPLDFTGHRRIIIPNGEVAWSAAGWGWRMGSKHFDYHASLRAVSLGFARIPAGAAVRAVVRRIELLDDRPGRLRDPVVHVGAGRLLVKGDVGEKEYLTYTAADGVRVFDANWNLLRSLDFTVESFAAPGGAVEARVEHEAVQDTPWLELQVITRGAPQRIAPREDGARDR